MDTYTGNRQGENIRTTWQTPVSIRASIRWLQVRGCPDTVMDFFSPFSTFSNIFSATTLIGPGVLQTLALINKLKSDYLVRNTTNETHNHFFAVHKLNPQLMFTNLCIKVMW